jgi:excisionase family DNA binding protein
VLSIAEVAQRLTCSAGFVRRLIQRGKLKAIKDGRFVRIQPEAVDDYLARHTTSVVSGRPQEAPPSHPAPVPIKSEPLPGPRKIHF